MAACFPLPWIENFLVWLAIVIGAIAFVNLIGPWILKQLGASLDGGVIIHALRIVVWVIVAIFVIHTVFDLLACFGSGLGLRGIR